MVLAYLLCGCVLPLSLKPTFFFTVGGVGTEEYVGFEYYRFLVSRLFVRVCPSKKKNKKNAIRSAVITAFG